MSKELEALYRYWRKGDNTLLDYESGKLTLKWAKKVIQREEEMGEIENTGKYTNT